MNAFCLIFQLSLLYPDYKLCSLYTCYSCSCLYVTSLTSASIPGYWNEPARSSFSTAGAWCRFHPWLWPLSLCSSSLLRPNLFWWQSVLSFHLQEKETIVWNKNSEATFSLHVTGEQHAHGGSGPSCVWLSDEAGPTWCSNEWRGGEEKHIITSSLVIFTIFIITFS